MNGEPAGGKMNSSEYVQKQIAAFEVLKCPKKNAEFEFSEMFKSTVIRIVICFRCRIYLDTRTLESRSAIQTCVHRRAGLKHHKNQAL